MSECECVRERESKKHSTKVIKISRKKEGETPKRKLDIHNYQNKERGRSRV